MSSLKKNTDELDMQLLMNEVNTSVPYEISTRFPDILRIAEDLG